MSNIVLVPGFWLGGWAWDQVAPAVRAAGHAVRQVTLPGVEDVAQNRSGIRLDDHIEALTSLVVESGEPVVLVGHSGAGAVVHGVLDRAPERVAVAVYVDSGPLPAGACVRPDVSEDAVEVPPPDWPQLSEPFRRDLSDVQLEMLARRAVPHPAGPARDPMVLHHDEARRAVPTVVITSTMTGEEVRAMAEAGEPYFRELTQVAVTYVELPTGHWPMFTRPQRLAAAIVSAADRAPAR